MDYRAEPGQLERYRRLSKDEELLLQASEAITPVMLPHLMVAGSRASRSIGDAGGRSVKEG